MGYLSTRSFCAPGGCDGAAAAGAEPVVMLLAIALVDETRGVTLDARGLFRCKINQIAIAAPSTMNRTVFTGKVFGVGDWSILNDRDVCGKYISSH